jgi:hypothetical protein
MKNAQDPSIQEGMIQAITVVTVTGKQEYITVGGTWVDYILCSSDIICSIVKPCQMMAVNAVVLEKYCVAFIQVSFMSNWLENILLCARVQECFIS